MLIGDTYYYRMHNDGTLTQDRDFDSSSPFSVSDDQLGEDAIAVWACRNGASGNQVAAGRRVRSRYLTDAAILDALRESGLPVA